MRTSSLLTLPHSFLFAGVALTWIRLHSMLSTMMAPEFGTDLWMWTSNGAKFCSTPPHEVHAAQQSPPRWPQRRLLPRPCTLPLCATPTPSPCVRPPP